ncbi:MAG: hypothetical protein DMF72_07890 [Acidobacteria bacterium]|nr:MAG: hypothetical protein DMF72_07890 [Acidobacteriota bacterium]
MNVKVTVRAVCLLLFFIFITLESSVCLRAQIDDKEKAEAAKQKELEKKTLNLLDEVIGAAWGLKLPANRSYVLATAADLLWPHDEKRARNLFWEALNNLNLPALQALDETNAKEPNNSAKPARTNGPTREQANQYYATVETRREFLRQVAQHDPQLALDMMRSTRQPPPPQTPGAFQAADDSDLEQEIAFAAAANDSKRALQIAHESMAKGLTFQILNLLNQVMQKDQDTGAQLAGEIIAKLKTENFSTSTFAPYIAIQLLQSARTDGAVLTASFSLNSSFKRLKLDDDEKQDLVGMLTNAALNATKPPNILLQDIRFVMPEIEQYAPDRAAKLKLQLTELNRTLPQPERDWNNFNAMFESATPEELIKAANKVADDQRPALFHRAAAKAVARGESDRYRELITSQLENEDERKVALDSLANEQMYYDISQGNADDLEKLLPLIRAGEQRAIAMSQLAMVLEKKDQHDEAVKLLDDARAMVKVDLANETQSNALLAVMLSYALVDPPKAFVMIEPIIDRANDDISKLLLVDKIVKSGAIKNGEIIMQQPQIPLTSSMLRYSPGVVALGRADFDRTKGLADRFQRNELRIVARLLLAQSILRHLEQTHSPNN